MKQNLSREAQLQDDQYAIPYHYIPQYEKGFSASLYYRFGINYVSTLEFLKEKLEELVFDSVCDVGAGDGRLVRELSSWFPGKKLCGLDYSERAVNLARGLNPGLEFIKTDIITDPPSEKYDVLTLIEVFEHIPTESCRVFVTALHGMLHEGGTLLITVPHINIHISPKHYQHFSSASLLDYFRDLFHVEEVVFFEKHRSWRVYWIRRLLKNKLFLLNNKALLNYLYRVYKKHCFHTEEAQCKRIFLKLRKSE